MSSVEDIDNYLTVHSLPYEVVVRIFEFLPLEDRKNVRLTCKSWYDCSTSSFITKKEKFVFRSGFCIQDIATTLFKPNFFQMNIEFQGLPISNLPAYIWKACGHRMHSLEFHDCRWNDKTIRSIILHCSNLASFNIHTSFCAAGHNLGNILCSPRLLNELVKMGVQQTKLHTFSIFIDDIHLPESVLKNIFLIYPAIKHFSTGALSYENSLSYCLVLHNKKGPAFSRPDKCLNSSTQLESLMFNLPTDGYWMKLATSDQRLRLKHFETMLISKPSMVENLFQFFTVQKDLKVIKLWLGMAGDEIVKKLTFHILESCPNLQEFCFKCDEPYQIYFKWDELPRFVALISKLQCLSISFEISEPSTSSGEILESLSPKNLALNALKLEHFDMNADFSVILLKRCSYLKHLELNSINDHKLQTIFEYLLNLETLVLNDVDECTDYGFIGQDLSQGKAGGYSIKRLQQLKYLDIYGSSDKITEKFILELQLPNLKTLVFNMELFVKLSKETLARLASNIPELISFATDGLDTDGCTKQAKKFCKRLKKLHRFLYLQEQLGSVLDGDLAYELLQFFEACPSLRYISDLDCNTYFFNPFTKNVLHKSSKNFKFQNNIFDNDLPNII